MLHSASVLIHSTVGVVNAALEADRRAAQRMIEHLKVMHLALLASWLVEDAR